MVSYVETYVQCSQLFLQKGLLINTYTDQVT